MSTLLQGVCQFHSLAVKRGFQVGDRLFRREKYAKVVKIPASRKNITHLFAGMTPLLEAGAELKAGVGAKQMTLTRLSLTDFRNHAGADMAAAPGLVALYGDNGAGKTNILEAISLLAPGRGLRRAALSDMVRDGASGGFAVFAEVQAGADLAPVALGTGIEAAQPGRRIVRINGATAAATALGDWLAVLWLTPAMDRLFVETAGNRRRFLDRLVLALDPRHAQHSNRYEAARGASCSQILAKPTSNGWRVLRPSSPSMARRWMRRASICSRACPPSWPDSPMRPSRARC